MELRQLEIFVSLVDNKSFSLTAEKLHLSQPTISSHIHALEQELQIQLIQRTTRVFEVTLEGEKLYKYALNIIGLKKKAIMDISGTNKKELYIGTSSVPGYCILPSALVNFRQIYNDTNYQIIYSDSIDIIQKVASGSMDIGLVGTKIESNCIFETIATDELVIVTENTEYYRKLLKENVSLHELLKEPIIIREDQSGTKQETEQFLSSINISFESLNIVAHINDAQALLLSIAKGLGISILSRKMVENMEKSASILVFPLGEYKYMRNLYAVYKESKYLPKIVQNFITLLKNSEIKNYN